MSRSSIFAVFSLHLRMLAPSQLRDGFRLESSPEAHSTNLVSTRLQKETLHFLFQCRIRLQPADERFEVGDIVQKENL